MIRALFIFFTCGAFAQTFDVVPTQWTFSQVGQVMTVQALFQSSVPGSYYLLRSTDLSSWTTVACLSATNYALRQITTQCPMDTTPRSYLRVVRGGLTVGCCCK